MTRATSPPPEATLSSVALATPFGRTRPAAVPDPLGRAANAILDVLAALGVILSIPFVILAIGLPLALVLRFLLWIGSML